MNRALPFLIVLTSASCGGDASKTDKTFVRGPRHADIELPQLEIHADGVDIFTTCPVSGSATQGWVPKIPPWSAAAGAAPAPQPSSASALAATSDGGAPDAAAGFATEDDISVQKRSDDPANAPTPTERAIRDTLRPFRACFRRGALLRSGRFREPEIELRDSRAAIVVRVGSDGRVVKAENYGACELSREVVTCMLQVGKRLRFDPPSEGSATIIIPAVFAGGAGISRGTPGPHDDYAAAAAIAIEGARPDLHVCEDRERRAVRPRNGWGNFILDVDENGQVARQNIDPWDMKRRELLECASEVFKRVQFPKPPGGSATVRVRLVFNRGESE